MIDTTCKILLNVRIRIVAATRIRIVCSYTDKRLSFRCGQTSEELTSRCVVRVCGAAHVAVELACCVALVELACCVALSNMHAALKTRRTTIDIILNTHLVAFVHIRSIHRFSNAAWGRGTGAPQGGSAAVCWCHE